MLSKKTFIIIAVVVIVLAILLAVFAVVFKKPKVEPLVIAEDIYGLSGEIKEIQNRILLVEANILLADLEKEPVKQMVKMAVTDKTKILRLEFPSKIPEGSTEPIFPKEIEIGFGDLKIGDKIDVQTINNASENIKNKTEIAVKVINVIE